MIKFLKKLGACFVLAMGLGISTQAFGAEEVNLSDDGLALHGFDPVSYHTGDAPVEGRAAFEITHDGAVYRFSSVENQELFASNPERYAPAYGGFCSYGVRVGRKFDIDPTAYQIVDGTLYVQLDQGTHLVWMEDKEKNIAIADRIWPSIRSVSASQLGE